MLSGRRRARWGRILPRILLTAIVAGVFCPWPGRGQGWDREAAVTALDQARELRNRLSADQSAVQADYLRCVRLYKRVYLSDPHFGGSDDAIYEAATLYQDMAAKFATPDYDREAAKLLRFLLKDYSTSSFRPYAILRLAASETAQTGAQAPVAGTPAERQAAARSVQPEPKAVPSSPPRPPATPETRRSSVIRSIRHWSTDGYTRVTIDLDGRAHYQETRVGNPDRIFFDLSNTKLGPEAPGKPIAVEDRLLRQIRAAQNRPDVVRVVLDLNQGNNCSVSELSDPFRIVIEVRKDSGPATPSAVVETPASIAAWAPQASPPPPQPAPRPAQPSGAAGKENGAKAASVTLPANQTSVPPQIVKAVPPASRTAEATEGPDRSKPEQPVGPNVPTQVPPAGSNNISLQPASPAAAAKTVPESKEPSGPPPDPVTAFVESAVLDRPLKPKPVEVVTVPPKAALPTSRGDLTLTRVLGLKVARIVIDPGHGGSDTGTVGRNGLMEKDLVLKVGRELRRALEARLGAHVVMTRENDEFVSLEQRTAVANRHKADLFVSIHANSSSSRSTSGVETYFLNMARTSAERQVAARENASTFRSVSELQELVRKIVMADKSVESRELAGILQQSLYTGSRKLFPKARNRGVRSAPFVVLVGAEMPAVLIEVAFISNPRDEKALKSGGSQQLLARALLTGIEGYIRSLSTYAAEAHLGSR